MSESNRSTDSPLTRALSLAADALSAQPAGLLTDFDGTLSPIVSDPAAAALVPGAAEALEALTRQLAVVAVVTGRAPLDARRMTGVDGLLIAGNHGTEWLEPDADQALTSARASAVRGRLDEVLARVSAGPGVTVEDKGMSVTVHYRTAEDPEEVRSGLLEALGEVGPELELRPGRMSLEIRPVGLGDKGAATRSIIERFGLRGAVVMGDDVTDLDMFRAVADLRDARRLRGAIIGVGGDDHEVPRAVAEAADVLLTDPVEAAMFLAALAEGTAGS